MKLKNILSSTFCFIILLSCSNDDNNNSGEVSQLENLVLSSPSEGESPVDNTAEFSWQAYTADGTVTYSLFLGTTSGNLSETASDLSNAEFSISESNALDLETTYFWQVVAYEDGIAVAESEVQSFTVETISHVLITENADYGPRKAAGIAVFNDKIWVIGGTDEGDNSLNDIWSSTDGENWINEGNFPVAIYGPKVIEFKGKLWVYGGVVLPLLSRAIYSSADGINWIEETETTPFLDESPGRLVVLNEKIYRIGGSFDFLDPKSVYSSSDGLNWSLETENHGMDTGNRFFVESLNNLLYSIEPNPDLDIKEINVRTSVNGVDWNSIGIFQTNERGNITIKTIVYNNSIILMSPPDGGPNSYSTFHQTFNGRDWQAVHSETPMPSSAFNFELVNLNGDLFAIGGVGIGNTYNTVWKLN